MHTLPPGTAVTLPELARAILRLTVEGGTGNRLVISRGPAWFVAHGTRGRAEVRVEAAASYYLPREDKIRTEDVYRLRQAGFGQAAQGRNLHRRQDLPDLGAATALAKELTGYLDAVYHRPEAEPLTISEHLGDTDPTDNPRVKKAIRELAGSRSQRARNRLYSELLSADLLVPVDEAGELLVFGDLEGWPVYGCFIDAASLHAWDPRGMSYRTVPGTRFFPALMQTRVGSLLINPGGRLGGELYRNEIEALAGAAQARLAR